MKRVVKYDLGANSLALIRISGLFLATFLAADLACAADRREAEIRVQSLERGQKLINDPEIQRSGIRFTDANSRIVIFRSWSSAPKILAGGFKNLHETGKTRGLHHTEKRKAMENTILQMDLDAKNWGNSFRPKYGIVLNSMTEKFASPAEHYGSVAWILKPHTFRRSTWSHVDSLELLRTENDLLWPKNFSVPYDERIFPFIGMPPPKLGKEAYLTYEAKLDDAGLQDARYIEAQVWGELTLDDVEQIVYVGEPRKEVLTQFEKAGVRTTRAEGQGLSAISKAAGIPETVFPKAGTGPLLAETYALNRPMDLFWDTPGTPRTPDSLSDWLRKREAELQSILDRCTKKFSRCSPFDFNQLRGFEHPYATTPEGLLFYAKAFDLYANVNPSAAESGIERLIADHLVHETYIQPRAFASNEGRALFLRLLTPPAKDSRYRNFVADSLKLLEKPFLWIGAPELGVRLVREAATLDLHQSLKTYLIEKATLSLADGHLRKGLPQWNRIRESLASDFKPSPTSCTQLLRPL